MTRAKQLDIGMAYDSVVQLLGQPTSTTKGAELIGGGGTVVGDTETRSRLFHTEFCYWNRPEGDYELTFEFGHLARVRRAPPGTVSEGTRMDGREKVVGRVVVVVFAEHQKDQEDACRKVLEDLSVPLDRNAVMNFLTDKRTAVDSDDERCVAFLTGYTCKLLEKHGLRNEVDIDRTRLLRFRTQSNAGAWNAGVVFVVPNSTNGVIPRTIRALWNACCLLAGRRRR